LETIPSVLGNDGNDGNEIRVIVQSAVAKMVRRITDLRISPSHPREHTQQTSRIALSSSRASLDIHKLEPVVAAPWARCFHLTGGEASDSRNFETLLDVGPDINPRAALGDKGYDSKSNRGAARQRGICPAIPYRSNYKARLLLVVEEIVKRGESRV
jgi:hypothetical protein